MIGWLRNWSLVVMVLSATAHTAFGENEFFHLRFMRHPFTPGQCSASAQRLGQRFSEVTGLRVTSSKCLATSRHGADMEVTYTADRPVQFTSTYDSEAVNPQGFYATRDACLADLDQKVQQFRRATALEPIAAYCMQDRADNASTMPFLINITAAGQPEKDYHVISMPMIYGPDAADEFVAQVKSHLQGRPGLELAFVGLTRDQFGSIHLLVAYYADFVFRMQEIRQIIFTDVNACRAEIPFLEAGLAAYGASLIASTCQFDLYESVMLRSFYAPGPRITLEDSHQDFATYQDCVAGRQGVLEFLRTELGWDVSAVICVRSGEVSALAVRRVVQ